MIKPKKNFLITRFFNWYIPRIIKKHFHTIGFDRTYYEHDRAILLMANHFSWWDGFLLYHLCTTSFKKTFHAMVLEETMNEVGFFKYLGGFSIAKNSKEMIKSLTYAAELLNDPNNMVVIFPQGKLYSNFVHEVKFEKGVFKIIELATADYDHIFAATFIENFEHKKPTVYINLENCSRRVATTPQLIEAKYNEFYRSAKLKQTNKTV